MATLLEGSKVRRGKIKANTPVPIAPKLKNNEPNPSAENSLRRVKTPNLDSLLPFPSDRPFTLQNPLLKPYLEACSPANVADYSQAPKACQAQKNSPVERTKDEEERFSPRA